MLGVIICFIFGLESLLDKAYDDHLLSNNTAHEGRQEMNTDSDELGITVSLTGVSLAL